MKRKPRCEGKRKVGMALNSNESEEATPIAVPMSGAVRSAVRRAEGATSERRGCRVECRENGLVLCVFLKRRERRKVMGRGVESAEKERSNVVSGTAKKRKRIEKDSMMLTTMIWLR